MARGDLTESQWQNLQPLLPPERTDKRGRPYQIDHRTSLNGMLFILRTGAPWRDLPPRYGPWQSAYDRMTRWKRLGLWEKILKGLQGEAQAGRLPGGAVDFEGRAIDSTTVKAHPDAAGARHAPAKKGAVDPARPVAPLRKSRTRRRESFGTADGRDSEEAGEA